MNGGRMVRFGREPYGGVGTVTAVGVPPEFSRHAHAGWVMGLAERGGRRMALPGRVVDVPEGGLFVIPPDTPHACSPLGPPPHAHRAVCLPGDTLRDLMHAGDRSACGDAAALFRRFFGLVDADAPPWARRRALAAALGALPGLAAAARRPERGPAPDGVRAGVERAASYLAGQAWRNPSLDETARHAGVSPFHLHRLFAARFGLPPHAFVMRHRLRLGLAALEAGHSVAQAAVLAGFADQSHFTRQFRRAVGVTPGRFVRSRGAGQSPGA